MKIHKEFLRKTEQPKNDELEVEFHITTATLHTIQQTPNARRLDYEHSNTGLNVQ